MGIRWQDEVRWLYGVYAEEKRGKTLGAIHWAAYLSKYAELRREEITDIKIKGIRYENTIDIVNERINRLHPIVWAWTMNWYNDQ